MSELYDHDFHGWASLQAQLLREGRVSEADLGHIAVATGYRYALQRIDRETGLPRSTFPAACPYEAGQVLHSDFLPGEP